MIDSDDRRRENRAELRRTAHDLFDRIWQNPHAPAFARDASYKWLACQMGLSHRQCHFGKLHNHQLRKAITALQHTNWGIINTWWQLQSM